MKKILAIVCAALMLLTLFACGGVSQTDLAGTTVVGRVEKIDGSVITLRVTEDGGKADSPRERGAQASGQLRQQEDGGLTIERNGGSGFGTESDGRQSPQARDGQTPETPERRERGRGERGDFGAVGNGDATIEFGSDGSGEAQTPPELPDGQQPPELPDGQQPPEMPDGQQPPELPADGGVQPDDGFPLTFGVGGDTLDVDLALADASSSASAEDVKVGDVVKVTFDAKGAVVSVQVMNARSGGRGGMRGGNAPEADSAEPETSDEDAQL